MTKELPIPPATSGDARATEMIRVWLAHSDFHVSLHLGMHEDSDDSKIDERNFWGCLFADLTRHVARGMSQSHNWDPEDTIAQIRSYYLSHLADDEVNLRGDYGDGQNSADPNAA